MKMACFLKAREKVTAGRNRVQQLEIHPGSAGAGDNGRCGGCCAECGVLCGTAGPREPAEAVWVIPENADLERKNNHFSAPFILRYRNCKFKKPASTFPGTGGGAAWAKKLTIYNFLINNFRMHTA
ncbi:MAG: hypothetical protein ACOY40_04200 [Bacillota bacterium]